VVDLRGWNRPGLFLAQVAEPRQLSGRGWGAGLWGVRVRLLFEVARLVFRCGCVAVGSDRHRDDLLRWLEGARSLRSLPRGGSVVCTVYPLGDGDDGVVMESLGDRGLGGRAQLCARAALRDLAEPSVAVFDRDLRCVLVAGDAAGRLGLGCAGVKRRPIADVQPPERCTVCEPLFRVVLLGETSSVEVPAIDGRCCRLDVGPWGTEAGELTGALGVVSRYR
jgi:hypothetical protein